MKRKLMVLFLLAGSSMFAGTRFVVGFGVPLPVPAPVVTYAAPYPAPVVTYAPGPYYRGYWARPYARSVWVGPRWYRGHYYRGYWRR
jgi:hypothetical protein